MDAVYLFRHSVHSDAEIRFSLRSLERHAPHFRKVWIFGDRPEFLSRDRTIIQHAPHAITAPHIAAKIPVTNFFLLNFLASIVPGVSTEFVRFSDDYILLKDFSEEEARKVRYLKNLAESKTRGTGKWRSSLWKSYDFLKSRGLPGYNFETHAPTYLRKEWVRAAYFEFRDFAKEGRYRGLIGNTEILNLALHRQGLPIARIESGERVGFYGTTPKFAEVRARTAGARFMNFDDAAFGAGIRQFLETRFPEKSRFEK